MAATHLPLERMQPSAGEACALLKTLSHPDRMLILCRLARGEARVGELAEALGIVQPTLSQQLMVLRTEDLVTTRRQGKNIYYSLASLQALAVLESLYQQFCCGVLGPAGERAKARRRVPAG